jgi:hypothetical protein
MALQVLADHDYDISDELEPKTAIVVGLVKERPRAPDRSNPQQRLLPCQRGFTGLVAG